MDDNIFNKLNGQIFQVEIKVNVSLATAATPPGLHPPKTDLINGNIQFLGDSINI